MTSLASRDVRMLLAGAVGVCVLTASSYVSIPVGPVPVTLQTLAVLLVGVVMGPRVGALTVITWLALAFAGAPVLAGATGGPLPFTGPTAGYLVSFPIVAFLAGMLPRAASLLGHGAVLAGMVALHGLVLLMGWAWLSVLAGPQAAFMAGVMPFLLGSLVKGALAAALAAVLPRNWRF